MPSPDTSRCPCARFRLLLLVLLALGVAFGLAACGDEDDPAGPSPEPVAAAIRVPRSFYVDPRFGTDAGSGSKAAPFKTLAHALSVVITDDTVRLASGVYSAAVNGELFTNAARKVIVPAGVTILGTLAEDFTSQLVGQSGDSVGLLLAGGATVRNLAVSGFRTGIRASAGVQTFRNIVLNGNQIGLDARGAAQPTLTTSTFILGPRPELVVIGVLADNQARVTVDSTTLSAGGQNCRITRGVELKGTSRLTTRRHAKFVNLGGSSVMLLGGSQALVSGSTSIERAFDQAGGGCTPEPAVAAYDSSGVTVRNSAIGTLGGSATVGVYSESRHLLTLDHVAIQGHSLGFRGNAKFKLAATATTFAANEIGIDAKFANGYTLTVTGCTFDHGANGIRAGGFKLRGSTFNGFTVGILLTTPAADLGRLDAPGNNTFTNQALSSIAFGDNMESGTVQASGNTWKPLTQGSDAGGHYAAKPLVAGGSPNASGENFLLRSGSFKIQL